MIKNLIKHNKYSIITLCSVALILGVWEIAATALGKDYLLPRFSAVMVEFFALFTKRSFYVKLGGTLLRCVIGFVCSYALGFGLGILGGKYPAFNAVIRPVTSFLKTTPVMALTLMLLVWFRSSITPSIIGFILVFPIVYATISDNVAAINPKLLQVAAVYDFTKKEKLRYLYFPEIAPTVFSLLVTTFGMTIKAVISAEILSYTNRSLGLSMYIAKSDIFEGTTLLFAYVFVAVLVSALFEFVLTMVKRKVCAKY